MSTIVAISTAPGIGGIGIVRLSGKNTLNIIEKIFKQKHMEKTEEIKGYTMKYGYIVNPKNEKIIDEVLVSFFKAPKSYTTEDMCEINSHGGIIILREILDVCIQNGAIIAEPGEFTKRAFLNGRIDLTQAEAVINVIEAKGKKEALTAINQLKGDLKNDLDKIKAGILDILANIEASIDYPEYDVEEESRKEIEDKLISIKAEITKLFDSFEKGKIIKDGIKIAIIGKPNSGKSSLLNALLKEDRAIVTEYEGTTRDTIEEFINIEGISTKIIDTAGIRETDNEVEKIGINKTKETIDESDLIFAVFDNSKDLSDEDEEILNLINNKKAIIILNKKDLKEKVLEKNHKIINMNKKVINISAKEKDGINQIYETVVEMFHLNQIEADNEVVLTNLRHKQLVSEALENCNEALKTLKDDMPIDIIAINVKEILESIGRITGDTVSEEIIKEIFSKFCLGK